MHCVSEMSKRNITNLTKSASENIKGKQHTLGLRLRDPVHPTQVRSPVLMAGRLCRLSRCSPATPGVHLSIGNDPGLLRYVMQPSLI